MRTVPILIAALTSVLLVAESAQCDEASRKEGYADCTKTYHRCVKRSDDWYERSDRSRVENRDTYDQMIDTCTMDRRLCERYVERSAASVGTEGDGPFTDRESLVPEPQTHWPTGQHPRTTGSPKS